MKNRRTIRRKNRQTIYKTGGEGNLKQVSLKIRKKPSQRTRSIASMFDGLGKRIRRMSVSNKVFAFENLSPASSLSHASGKVVPVDNPLNK